MRGVHVDFATAGNADALGNILAAAEPDKGLNALELDVKDEKGVIGVPVDVALAKKIGAVQPQYDAARWSRRRTRPASTRSPASSSSMPLILAAKGGNGWALEKKGRRRSG